MKVCKLQMQSILARTFSKNVKYLSILEDILANSTHNTKLVLKWPRGLILPGVREDRGRAEKRSNPNPGKCQSSYSSSEYK